MPTSTSSTMHVWQWGWSGRAQEFLIIYVIKGFKIIYFDIVAFLYWILMLTLLNGLKVFALFQPI